MSLVLCALLAASPQELREEQADVNDRLEAERLALESLQSSTAEVLTVIDVFERMTRASQQRSTELARLAFALDARAAPMRAEAEAARLEAAERQAVMAPRLLNLYRVLKENQLTRLVSAQSFGALVRRERGLSTLVKADLEKLEEVSVLARYQARQAERIGLLEDTAAAVASELQREQALAQGRRAALDDLIRTLTAETHKSSRIVKDLERADLELTALIADMKQQAADLGLRTRKGHLPYPVSGIVEVGFGKVVNPRFNTVTVQKGIDLRAAVGTHVYCVGQGTVVYSGWLKGYGNLVIVDHGGGYHSLYAHLEKSDVEVGNELEEGEELGSVGDTGSLKGAYLYFEIRREGQAIDPLPWLAPQE
jgi:murein DD-endopeptidase MepM/ murein hydrolase activator NlpD